VNPITSISGTLENAKTRGRCQESIDEYASTWPGRRMSPMRDSQCGLSPPKHAIPDCSCEVQPCRSNYHDDARSRVGGASSCNQGWFRKCWPPSSWFYGARRIGKEAPPPKCFHAGQMGHLDGSPPSFALQRTIRALRPTWPYAVIINGIRSSTQAASAFPEAPGRRSLNREVIPPDPT